MSDNILYKRVGLFNKPVCRQCGTVFKFSELDKLDKTTGLCRSCMIKAKQAETGSTMTVKAYQNSNRITVGVAEDDVILPEDLELEACERVKALLSDRFDPEEFIVAKKSRDYTTLVYKEYDVMRVKITPFSKWLSVYVLRPMQPKYAEDPRFALQDNKRQIMWKAAITGPEDVLQFEEFFVNTCENAEKHAAGAL